MLYLIDFQRKILYECLMARVARKLFFWYEIRIRNKKR